MRPIWSVALPLCLVLAGCSAKKEAESESEKPVATLSALELWRAYYSNAIAADQKYKGKMIKITGAVERTTSDSVGFGVVATSGLSRAEYNRLTPQEKKWWSEGYPPNVVCKINPAFRESFAGATRGKEFAVIGRCLGSRNDPDVWSGLLVELEDCRGAP